MKPRPPAPETAPPAHKSASSAPEPDRPDLLNRQDLDTLLRQFYQHVLTDPIIGFYFTQITVFDLEQHLPRVGDFWAGQLFGELNYQGRTFEQHLALHRHTALTEHHFHRWLHLFNNAVDAQFSGPGATAIKTRAAAIGQSMSQALTRHDTETGPSQGIFQPPE